MRGVDCDDGDGDGGEDTHLACGVRGSDTVLQSALWLPLNNEYVQSKGESQGTAQKAETEAHIREERRYTQSTPPKGSLHQ